MDGNDSVLTYGQLIGEVRRLCAQHQTGRMFITTSDNHSVSFGLQNGAIVALSFRNQTGLEALASIQRVHKGSLSFASGLPPKPQPGLPPTPELLALHVVAWIERLANGGPEPRRDRSGADGVSRANGARRRRRARRVRSRSD